MTDDVPCTCVCVCMCKRDPRNVTDCRRGGTHVQQLHRRGRLNLVRVRGLVRFPSACAAVPVAARRRWRCRRRRRRLLLLVVVVVPTTHLCATVDRRLREGGGSLSTHPPIRPSVSRCSLCARVVSASRHRERSPPPPPPIRYDEAKTGGPPGKRRPCVRVSANVFLRARSSRKPPAAAAAAAVNPSKSRRDPKRNDRDGLSTLQRSAAAATAVFLNFSSAASSKTNIPPFSPSHGQHATISRLL